MKEKVLLNIFILCVIFFKGSVGTVLENDIDESSNVLVRKKRVISRIPEEDIPVSTGAFPFVVNIKSNNKRIAGIGSILSPRTVITAAQIFALNLSEYKVTSASTYTFLGVVHNITNKEVMPTHRYRQNAGIALIFVSPPLVHRHAGIINLHSGPLLTGMQGVVIGWSSSIYGGRQETRCPGRLRAITVPIINHRECVNTYQGFFDIRDDNVCTYHEQKQCGVSDVGAPLVIDNELVGIHMGMIFTSNPQDKKPDVFILLQHLQYSQWIRSHIIQ